MVGGASIALTVDGRRSTDDIDAIIKPADVVLSAAREVARKRGIPENWLNDAGRGFVPDSATWGECWATGGLRVWNATPAMVLAMKQATTRLKDFADLAVCYDAAGYASVQEAVAAFQGFYPDGLPGRTPTDEDLTIDLEDALRQRDRSRLPGTGAPSVKFPLPDSAAGATPDQQ